MLKKGRNVMLSAAILGTTLFGVGGLTVNAAPSTPLIEESSTDDVSETRKQEINDYFYSLNQKKAKAFGLENKINEIEGNSVELNKLQNEYEILVKEIENLENNSLEIVGLEKMDNKLNNETGIGILDSGDYDDPTAENVSLYYDRYGTNKWVLTVTTRWKNRSWQGDFDMFPLPNRNVGGKDGLYAGIGVDITIRDNEFLLFDSAGDQVSITPNRKYTTNGYSWLWQDQIGGIDAGLWNSQVASGYIYFDFTDPSSLPPSTNYYGGYVHTWANTVLNSIGVGPYSASFGWTTYGTEWYDEALGAVDF